MNKNVAVRFLTSYRQYNRNEVAGFPPSVAASLVNQGAAKYYETAQMVADKGEAEVTADPVPVKKVRRKAATKKSE